MRLNGMYWLTGSQQFHLMKNVSESLAGRVAIINLGGISQGEEKERKNDGVFNANNISYEDSFGGIVDIYERIHRGRDEQLPQHRRA